VNDPKQLLGIKGASETSSIWKLRIQLMKPITWIPLIWGVICGAAASGNFEWTFSNVLASLACMLMSGPLLAGYTQTINDFFDNEIRERNIKPTKFLPLWDLLGVGLGFGSTILGKKAAMLCTASVEEVIDKHYQSQINQLEDDEKKLREKIKKFRADELEHKDIAYEHGATKKGI